MSQPNPFQLEPLEPVSIKELIAKYTRNWAWFLLSLALCLLVAVIYLRYATKEYRIDSSILISDNKGGSDLLQGNNLFSDLELFQNGKNIDDEIEVLRGKTLMQRVIADLKLQVVYYKKGNVTNTEVYGTQVPVKVTVDRLDSAAYEKEITIKILSDSKFQLDDANGKVAGVFGKKVNRPYGSFTVMPSATASAGAEILCRFQNVKSLTQDYLDNLTIAPVNKTGNVLKLSINQSVPQKGIDILNKLIEQYNLEIIENKNEIAAKTILFIDDRLIYLVKELSGVERDVENYKRKNDVTDISSESQQYLANTSDYERRLGEYEIQINILQSIQNYVSSSRNEFDLVPSSLTVQDATLLELINNFNQLQQQRRRLLKSNYEGSPVIVNLTEQLTALRKNIIENISNIKQGLVIARKALQNKNVQYDGLKKQVPSIERELLEIKRQQSIKESLYQYLLQKREEASLSKAASVSNVKIIDNADADTTPVKPKRSVILLIAALAGLFLPIGIIALSDLFNNKVSNIEDARKTGIPVLGEIIHSLALDKFIVKRDSRTIISEQFRLLRSKIHLSAADDKNQTMLITSTMSGEGKTFFSINIGATLAFSGKKVILLEFDLRKPKLLNELRLSVHAGITNYIVSNTLSVEDVIVKVPEADNLYVIGCGDMPPNPSELILSNKVAQLMDYLKERFDHIIIDLPPAGFIADAYTLSKFADRTIYLLRYNYTLKDQLNQIKEIYEDKSLVNMMIVLNDGRKENIKDYSYGYNYGYDLEQEKNLPFLRKIFRK